MNLKETLNLPDPEFSIPMKADLAQREPAIQAAWDEIGIYGLIQADRKDAPVYLLHDGPPYTNGPIHIGTGFQKILKDFVLKSRTMMGFRCPYVPGYDNHGLPIEQAVQAKLAKESRQVDMKTLRAECRAHAKHFADTQTSQFKRLGIFGMWDRPYLAMDPKIEAEIVRVFGRLVEGGYVYRGLRPVMWSPTLQSALADTEIVYKEDYVSTSIYVKFPLSEDPHGLFDGLSNVSTVIWTTTPWTIPANLALAFHPALQYDVVRVGGDHFVVLSDLVVATASKCGWSDYAVVRSFEGKSIEGTTFAHPIFGRPSVAVLAEYVTVEDGTGVVHTAPGHGRDDFYTGQRYGLPVLCPVDAGGMMTSEAGEFAGLYYKKANRAVVDRLAETGSLLFEEDYVHSYPHAERDEMPVIFRATEQWFVGIDTPFHLDPTKTLREKMLEEIGAARWHPASGQDRITSMIGGRPDWCVSRQRPWGVGIPVFYGAKSGEPVLDPVVIEHIAKVTEEHGSDGWFLLGQDDLLPAGYVHPVTGETEFRKETDVFDVWFDSGSTHLAVLEGNVEPRWKEDLPADLYLEGSDQHRGWFNVSLIIGTACRGAAPFKTVVTHGFVMAQDGTKMSKRKGNVVDPVAASDEFGAEILRHWAASVNYEDDVPCGPDLIRTSGEHYRSVRNTLRFLLGNLGDFEPRAEAALSLTDRWVMQEADDLVARCRAAYEAFDFKGALFAVQNFCTNQLSRFYLDSIKDTMYCDGADWPSRRGAQRACHYVLQRVNLSIAPVLCHTAEEVYTRIPGIDHKPSVHLETFPQPEVGHDPDLALSVETMLQVRARAFAEFEVWKASSGLKNTQDIDFEVSVTDQESQALIEFGEGLANLFKCASVSVKVGDGSSKFSPSTSLDCQRSRVRRTDVEVVEWNGEQVALSARDRKVLGV